MALIGRKHGPGALQCHDPSSAVRGPQFSFFRVLRDGISLKRPLGRRTRRRRAPTTRSRPSAPSTTRTATSRSWRSCSTPCCARRRWRRPASSPTPRPTASPCGRPLRCSASSNRSSPPTTRPRAETIIDVAVELPAPGRQHPRAHLHHRGCDGPTRGPEPACGTCRGCRTTSSTSTPATRATTR